jgi:putative ABC transport system permease protein
MWLEYIRIGLKVLAAHKFRSFLTVLSITIGAFSIVVMSSMAESGLATLARGIEDLGGGRLIDVAGKVPERAEDKRASYAGGLTTADRDRIFEALPHVVEKSLWAPLGRKDLVSDTGLLARADVIAADSGFLSVMKMELARGRNFSEEENRAHARVCVIGDRTAVRLWGDASLGRWLSTDGIRCRVVGVLSAKDRFGVNFGFDWKELVVAPYETLKDVDPRARLAADLLVKTDDQSANEVVKRVMNAVLVERHHGVDDYEIFDLSRFMDKFHQVVSIMEAIVGFIAGIALFVGGVGVMNMMLVSVNERVREIGIRKALGASPRDIAAQFLWEAAVLSGTGGVIGVVGGIAGALLSAWIIHQYIPSWVGIVARSAVIIALSTSLCIGVVFGFFPARRAARLDAINAIRT